MANVLNFSYFFFTISLSFSAIFCPLCSPVWENWGCTGQDCKDSTCQARPGASWAFPGAWAGVPGTAWAPHHQPWPASSAPHHLNNARKVFVFGHFSFHNSLFVLQCQTWYLRIMAELFFPLTFQVSHDIPCPPVSPRHLCQFVRAWRLGCWWGWMTPFLFIDRRPPLHSNSASAEPSAEFWRMRTLWGAACDTRYLGTQQVHKFLHCRVPHILITGTCTQAEIHVIQDMLLEPSRYFTNNCIVVSLSASVIQHKSSHSW